MENLGYIFNREIKETFLITILIIFSILFFAFSKPEITGYSISSKDVTSNIFLVIGIILLIIVLYILFRRK